MWSPSHSYPVFSQYFDTEDFLFWRQKINGEYIHEKIRLRQYVHTWQPEETCWVEFKLKRGESGYKWRQRLPRPVLKVTEFPEGYPLRYQGPYYPLCSVLYQREAFEMMTDGGRLRLTFDSSLRAKKHQEDFQSLNLDFILLEIKSDEFELPGFLQQLLKEARVTQKSFSKYGAAMELLYSQGPIQVGF